MDKGRPLHFPASAAEQHKNTHARARAEYSSGPAVDRLLPLAESELTSPDPFSEDISSIPIDPLLQQMRRPTSRKEPGNSELSSHAAMHASE